MRAAAVFLKTAVHLCRVSLGFGWGLEVALACDLRLAAAEATLCFPETGLGIFPGAGGTPRLAHQLPIATAKELIFTARRVAERALARARLSRAPRFFPLPSCLKQTLTSRRAHPFAAPPCADYAYMVTRQAVLRG